MCHRLYSIAHFENFSPDTLKMCSEAKVTACDAVNCVEKVNSLNLYHNTKL